MKTILTIALALSLTACGGGGGSSTPTAPDKQATQTTQAINDALNNIAAATPAPKPFTGAAVLINGVPQGVIAAPSEAVLVRAVAQVVMDNPAKYSDFYKSLLSDAGMKITVVGEPRTSAYGVVSSNDTIYTAKLTANGLVIS